MRSRLSFSGWASSTSKPSCPRSRQLMVLCPAHSCVAESLQTKSPTITHSRNQWGRPTLEKLRKILSECNVTYRYPILPYLLLYQNSWTGFNAKIYRFDLFAAYRYTMLPLRRNLKHLLVETMFGYYILWCLEVQNNNLLIKQSNYKY